MATAYQIVQLVYWLALSAWFGSVLFALLAAPAILRAVRAANPIMTDVLSVNLDGQHGTLLAGTINAELVRRLGRVGIVCAGGLLVSMAVQPFVINLGGGDGGPAVARVLLFLVAVGVAFYDRQYVWPRVTASRAEYVEHADEPDVANPVLDRFDAAQRLSLYLLYALAGLLMGLVLFSVTMEPKRTFAPAASSTGR